MGREEGTPKDGTAPEFQLRPCRPPDCEAIKEAHTQVLPIQYEDDFFQRICWSKGTYSAVYAAPVSDQHRLAGFLSARRMPLKYFCFNDRQALHQAGVSLQLEDQVLYLLTIGVVPEFRRQGVAGLMIRFAVEAARDQGCHAVMLHTKCGNDVASSLYRKHHFICLRRHRGFYRLPSPQAPPEEQTVHDGLVFALPLRATNTPHHPHAARPSFLVDAAAACRSPCRHSTAAKHRARVVAAPPGTAAAPDIEGGGGAVDDPDEFQLCFEEPGTPRGLWAGTCAAALARSAHGALCAVLGGMAALLPLRGWLSMRVTEHRGAPKAAAGAPGGRALRWGGPGKISGEAVKCPRGAPTVVDLEAGIPDGDWGAADAEAGCRAVASEASGGGHGPPALSDDGVAGLFRRLFKRTRR